MLGLDYSHNLFFDLTLNLDKINIEQETIYIICLYGFLSDIVLIARHRLYLRHYTKWLCNKLTHVI